MQHVNDTVWLCDEVVNETVVSSAVKLLIDGLWSSVFLIVMLSVWVDWLPAASLTVTVKLSWYPQNYSHITIRFWERITPPLTEPAVVPVNLHQ